MQTRWDLQQFSFVGNPEHRQGDRRRLLYHARELGCSQVSPSEMQAPFAISPPALFQFAYTYAGRIDVLCINVLTGTQTKMFIHKQIHPLLAIRVISLFQTLESFHSWSRKSTTDLSDPSQTNQWAASDGERKQILTWKKEIIKNPWALICLHKLFKESQLTA